MSSDSLQSPYDPDATYGHKGKGYESQIAETCDDDNPYQVITGTAVNGIGLGLATTLTLVCSNFAVSLSRRTRRPRSRPASPAAAGPTSSR